MALEHNSLGPDPPSHENVPIEYETITTPPQELEMLFGPMFDEYFNGATEVVSKSSAVTTADATDTRQQPNTTQSAATQSTSTTVAADLTQLNIQTTPEPTTQAPTVTATENIIQAENAQVDEDEFINIFGTDAVVVGLQQEVLQLPRQDAVSMIQTASHLSPDAVKIIQMASPESGLESFINLHTR
ncbi:hypothetical protein Tco_0432576 [Tanacetum coccineum]